MEHSIFSDLFYGNLDFTDNIVSNPHYRKNLQKLYRIDDMLHREISKSASRLFDNYVNQDLKLQSMEIENAFKQGFSLATKIFKEVP